MTKIAFAVLVLTPLTKPEAVQGVSMAVGVTAGSVLAFVGYLFDGMEVKP